MSIDIASFNEEYSKFFYDLNIEWLEKYFFELTKMAVTAARQGAGLGRALMDAAEKMARKSGASRIDLETAIDNYDAQALYQSLGYQREVEFYKYSLDLD